MRHCIMDHEGDLRINDVHRLNYKSLSNKKTQVNYVISITRSSWKIKKINMRLLRDKHATGLDLENLLDALCACL